MKQTLLPLIWLRTRGVYVWLILTFFFSMTSNAGDKIRNDRSVYYANGETPVFLQDTVITGKITDENGAPIAGANILEKGSVNGVISDTSGNFSIKVASSKSILLISNVGFAAKEINVGIRGSSNVTLEAGSKKLDDVIVVGYGTQKRSELTNAVVQTTGKEIKKSNALSVSNALSGRLAGVFVNQRSAIPGFDDAEILVRGAATYRNSSALIVIDGVANADPDGLNRLDPNDIESISVLKDASAAIYGAQSAGGVILVTTKRGKSGKPTFDFNTTFTWSKPTMKIKPADIYQYTGVLNDRRELVGETPDFPEELINEFRNGTRRAENWYDALVDPPAKQSRQSIAMRGGTDRVRYFLSLGMANQGGIMREDNKTKLKQYNVRSNVDINVTDNFEVGLDITARQKNTESPQGGSGEIGAFATTSPLQEAYIGGDYRYPGEGWSHLNPAARLLSPGYRKNNTNVNSGTIRFKYNIPWVTGLTLDGWANIVKTDNYSKVFNYTWVYYERDATDPTKIIQKKSRSVEDIGLREDFSESTRLTANLKLSYNTVIKNDHKLGVFVSYEQMDYDDHFFWVQRLGFDSPLIDQLFAGSTNTANWNNSGSASELARRNYFGRATYDYQGKYLVGLSARYDGSSIFPEGSQYGFFPQASVGWVISKENFAPKVFSNLKLRASWGRLGNDRVNPFQFISAFGYAPGWVVNGQDARGLAATATANPNITWEVSEKTDLGLETGFMDNRLTFEIDLYKTKTSDILGKRQASIPGYTGLVLPDQNIGEMENQGIDLQAGYRTDIGPVNVRINANYSYTKNKIIYFDEAPQAEAYQKLEGMPLNSQLVYKSIGIYRTQDDLDKHVSYPGASIGSLIFADLNGDGEINSQDTYRYDATTFPKTTYGLNFIFDYKAFDLSILFQGQSGGKFRLDNGFSTSAGGNGLEYVALNTFSLKNPNAILPMINPNGIAAENTDFYYSDAKWMRLKNLQLGYNLPTRLLSNLKMSQLRVYFSGDNLIMIFNNLEKYGAGDPEFLSGKGAMYPNMRSLSLGLNLTF
jgi:TonB-linked SusC/RagA family outer membrane protein